VVADDGDRAGDEGDASESGDVREYHGHHSMCKSDRSSSSLAKKASNGVRSKIPICSKEDIFSPSAALNKQLFKLLDDDTDEEEDDEDKGSAEGSGEILIRGCVRARLLTAS
jgi:hypothetical protein